MAIVCMVKDSDDMRHVQVSVNKSNNLITFVTDPPHEDQVSETALKNHYEVSSYLHSKQILPSMTRWSA